MRHVGFQDLHADILHNDAWQETTSGIIIHREDALEIENNFVVDTEALNLFTVTKMGAFRCLNFELSALSKALNSL